MRNIAILIMVFFNLLTLNAQNFDTKYTRNYKSTYCGNESFHFTFESGIVTKTDDYTKSSEKIASKKESSNFDKTGYYYELWSPSWYLNSFGIEEYNKISKKAYKLLFDQKGGDVLYVFEFDTDLGTESGKFYFTQSGYEIYCK